jgi:hypothetical protein
VYVIEVIVVIHRLSGSAPYTPSPFGRGLGRGDKIQANIYPLILPFTLREKGRIVCSSMTGIRIQRMFKVSNCNYSGFIPHINGLGRIILISATPGQAEASYQTPLIL